MKTRSWNKLAVAGLAAFGLSLALVVDSLRAETAATNIAPSRTVAPAQINLPPVPAEVLRMSQAGMSDDVIVAYIQKSDNPYSLDADQIIYLHDLGLSSAVLDALVNHVEATANNSPPPTSNETTDQANSSSSETPPVTGAAADYYNSLAPYGSWVYVPAYGWCWQPTVVVVNSGWQPYCNNGCWLWTTWGWYWNSYYSWGWAPFHYGRWCQYPNYGWLWCPDRTWGPAWVCWRGGSGYCGWAALPPGACFTAHGGWTFNGVAVGVNFGFGLGAHCFTFCDYNHFCGSHPYDHFQHGHDAEHFFHDSHVNNNFAVDGQNHFVNRGVDPARIEGATHTRLQPVSVREMPDQRGHSGNVTRPDRLGREGNNQVIYRPNQKMSGMPGPFTHRQHSPSANHDGNYASRYGSNPQHAGGNTSQFQPGHQNNFRPSTPGAAGNHPYPNMSNQRGGGTGNPQMRNGSPPQGYQRFYSNSRQFTPRGNSAPAWRPAPTGNSVPAWHSAPSGYWNGGGRGGGGYTGGGWRGGNGGYSSGGWHGGGGGSGYGGGGYGGGGWHGGGMAYGGGGGSHH